MEPLFSQEEREMLSGLADHAAAMGDLTVSSEPVASRPTLAAEKPAGPARPAGTPRPRSLGASAEVVPSGTLGGIRRVYWIAQ
jgi:hypothetical protein